MPGGRYRNNDEKTPFYDESTQQAPIERVRNCHDVSQEALRKRWWVYDPSNKEWYTPQEFEIKFGRISHGNEKFIEQVQVRDPKDAVKAGFKKMLDMHIKLEEFVKKMTEYYKENK